MYKVTRDAHIKNGHLELNDLPFSNDAEVKVIIVPKVDLEKMSFERVQQLTQSISGNLSDDIIHERHSS
ncbi:conserved hypothetical protein [Beggiatoa sp. PS]|nr:conserved hypothetical protein [Beggiatoa sp. PS]